MGPCGCCEHNLLKFLMPCLWAIRCITRANRLQNIKIDLNTSYITYSTTLAPLGIFIPDTRRVINPNLLLSSHIEYKNGNLLTGNNATPERSPGVGHLPVYMKSSVAVNIIKENLYSTEILVNANSAAH